MTQRWREVLLDLKARGFRPPKSAVGDRAMGFRAALEETFPETRHPRGWVRKTAKVLNAPPQSVQPWAKKALHEIWIAPTRADAERTFSRLVQTYKAKYPKAVDKLIKDRDVLLSFYDFPVEYCGNLFEQRTRSNPPFTPSATVPTGPTAQSPGRPCWR